MKSGTEKRLMIVQQEHERAVRRGAPHDAHARRTLEQQAPRRASPPPDFSLIREVMEDPRMTSSERSREAAMLVTAMLARLRDPDLRPAEVKYMADGLHKIFTGDKKKPAPFEKANGSLRRVRLAEAYLADLGGRHRRLLRGVTCPTPASAAAPSCRALTFRNANLRNSVFAEADLRRRPARGASWGARFDKARNLDKARFNSGTTWDTVDHLATPGSPLPPAASGPASA